MPPKASPARNKKAPGKRGLVAILKIGFIQVFVVLELVPVLALRPCGLI